VTCTYSKTHAFNTAIAALIQLTNSLTSHSDASKIGCAVVRYGVECTVRMLSPMAPGIGEELWELLCQGGQPGSRNNSVFSEQWPAVDEEGLRSQSVTCVVQINGKMRSKLTLPADHEFNAHELYGRALNEPSLAKWVTDKETGQSKPLKRAIVAKGGKLVNFII
ncbi:Leucyl-tRNA synthetase, mitochondrial, partial [Spiromyces aspiralis]